MNLTATPLMLARSFVRCEGSCVFLELEGDNCFVQTVMSQQEALDIASRLTHFALVGPSPDAHRDAVAEAVHPHQPQDPVIARNGTMSSITFQAVNGPDELAAALKDCREGR